MCPEGLEIQFISQIRAYKSVPITPSAWVPKFRVG